MRLARANTKAVTIRWNGSPIEAREGDTVAAALQAHGIRIMSRSRKRHRPQGHSGSFINGVLARVDGRPNVRLDLEPVRHGMDIRMQNVWPSPGFDILKAAQLIPPRWLYAGFEHDTLITDQNPIYPLWEKFLAHLAGMGQPPSAGLAHAPVSGRRLAADTVVIGAGPAGCRAANEAAARGERVALVTRGSASARFARMMGLSAPVLDPRIEILWGMEAFGLYRGGSLVACAPHAHDKGGVLIETSRTIIATGRRSCPPLVPGNNLPGVIDAHAALTLAADHGVAPGTAVAVVGTGAEAEVAGRLGASGVNVVAILAVASVRRVAGRRRVTGIEGTRRILCDCVVHAGPWRRDANLLAQVQAPDASRPGTPPDSERVTFVGLEDEPVVVGSDIDETTMICPCMDVSWGEIAHHFEAGEADVEVLKRLTACGMGPCQGTPCWDLMAAEIAHLTGTPAAIGQPTQRDPRRALTVAQAAGMDGLVGADR